MKRLRERNKQLEDDYNELISVEIFRQKTPNKHITGDYEQ